MRLLTDHLESTWHIKQIKKHCFIFLASSWNPTPHQLFLLTLTSCSGLWDLWGGQINKVYSSTGTERGTLILAPVVRSLTSTCGPDGCSGQLLFHSYTVIEQSLPYTHLLLFLLFVSMGLSVWNKSRRKWEKREMRFERQLGAWWWKETLLCWVRAFGDPELKKCSLES